MMVTRGKQLFVGQAYKAFRTDSEHDSYQKIKPGEQMMNKHGFSKQNDVYQ